MKTLKLMADYQCHPLWDMTPGKYGDINPNDLPISEDLKSKLAKWAYLYDETMDMDDPIKSGFRSENEAAEFIRFGNEIAGELMSELGENFSVIVKINV